MTHPPQRVVIVGGGVVGVACAHYLLDAGAPVTLIDRRTIGSGCSHGNCGYVCPSHVLPLAGPGVLGKTLATLFQRDSPLSIRFRFDPALWSWFWRFARCCNRAAMLESARSIQALLNSSRTLYGQLFRDKLLDAEWEELGMLFVFRSPREMEHYAHTDQLLRDSFDMPATRYDSDALARLEPALRPGLAGAWHYPLDAHLRPDRLMSSWKDLLVRRGVDLREQCDFRGLEHQAGHVRGVITSQGTIPADQVVIATGAWTPLLARYIGQRLPIIPGKGYSITMARPRLCPRFPLIFEEDRVAITPMQTGYRIGSTMEFAGYDESLDRGRLHLLRRAARLYLQEPEADPVSEEWWGWRPMVADGRPILGRLSHWHNLFVAAGHSMLGVAMATGSGRLIAELLTGQTPHVDPAPYSAARF